MLDSRLIGDHTNKRLSETQSIPKFLLFGYGNPGRGDDALGVMLVNQIELRKLGHVTCQIDMQLLIEHVTDLADYDRILFVDADMSCDEPFIFSAVQASKDESYTSHALTPAALLYVFQQVYQRDAPPAFLMQIRGYDFELGDSLSEQAANNLRDSVKYIDQLTSYQL